MTDKISKAVAKLSAKEKQVLKQLLVQLQSGNSASLHITKLKGHDDIFRIRKGQLRVIYRVKNGKITVLATERRTNKTYRNF